jgi:hypothetical protein
MNSLGVFGKTCVLHSDKYISEICMANNCDKRIICIECRKNHNSQHWNYFQPLLDFLSVNIEDETNKAKIMEQECEDTLGKVV